LVLIKWIEVLYSVSNVNILQKVPEFIEKLLSNIDLSGSNQRQQSDIAKKVSKHSHT
jgi:hypothetical protein